MERELGLACRPGEVAVSRAGLWWGGILKESPVGVLSDSEGRDESGRPVLVTR